MWKYDKGLVAEKLNSKPVTKTFQKFVKVERGRTYHSRSAPSAPTAKKARSAIP